MFHQVNAGTSRIDSCATLENRIMAKRQQTFQRAARKRKAEQRLRAAIARERHEQQELEQHEPAAPEQPQEAAAQDPAAEE
jgi:hypothetical protein